MEDRRRLGGIPELAFAVYLTICKKQPYENESSYLREESDMISYCKEDGYRGFPPKRWDLTAYF